MKLHAEPRSSRNTVTACGSDHVAVNGQTYRRSLLLLPGHLDAAWGPASYVQLALEHIVPLAQLECDVILLGTGQRQRFPSPAVLRPCYEAGRGIEIMDTAAACRTYNLLMTEGRIVAAALIIEPP